MTPYTLFDSLLQFGTTLWWTILSDPLDAISSSALGILQGLTEFLPVSSSAHLALATTFFGLHEPSISFPILLHIGTLVTTIIVFRKDFSTLALATARSIRSPHTLYDTEEGEILVAIAIVTLVTCVVGFGLHNLATTVLNNLHLLGGCFAVSAIVLLSTRNIRPTRSTIDRSQSIWIGLAQGVAVLPGISRSGMTIATAMLLGVRGQEAFRFSFLASLPVIVAAVLYEWSSEGGFDNIHSAWVGGVTALVTGYVALLFLKRVMVMGYIWMFALYLIPMALLLITQ